jgi:hypothetical protein
MRRTGGFDCHEVPFTARWTSHGTILRPGVPSDLGSTPSLSATPDHILAGLTQIGAVWEKATAYFAVARVLKPTDGAGKPHRQVMMSNETILVLNGSYQTRKFDQAAARLWRQKPAFYATKHNCTQHLLIIFYLKVCWSARDARYGTTASNVHQA